MTETHDLYHADDVIGYEADAEHASGGYMVKTYQPDGTTRAIFGGTEIDCAAIVNGVRAALATWPGWTAAPGLGGTDG